MSGEMSSRCYYVENYFSESSLILSGELMRHSLAYYLKNPGKSLRLVRIGIRSKWYCVQLRRRGAQLGRGVKILGKPIFEFSRGSLSIGEGVVLNSLNSLYHGHMYGNVKLLADKEGSKISIGSNTRIHGSCIHAWRDIQIGRNCLVAANCTIIDANGHATMMEDPEKRLEVQDEPNPIIIEDNVWIGQNCIILKGVRIGEGSVIGAGTVVRENIPPRTMYGLNK